MLSKLYVRWTAIIVTVLLVATARAEDPTVARARGLFLEGKYAEAEELYSALAEKDPAAAIGLARAQAAVGEHDKAVAVLTSAAKRHEKPAALPAELAALAFDRGDYAAAKSNVQSALKLEPDQLAARWIDAELHRTAGRLDEANKAYKWFVDYYNAKDAIKDAESLCWIGRAAAQYARWNRLSDQFGFLVNELLPNALAVEKQYWPAHLESGLLFLEKYNHAQATKEFKTALAINPNAAEAYAGLAELALQNYDLAEATRAIDRALEINPRLLRAHQLRASVHLSNFEAARAIDVLETARRLNPVSEETLGQLAAAYASVDGISQELAGTRMGKLIDDVNGRSAHAGEFYFALAAGLDRVRKFPAAARFYKEAMTRMPQLTAVRGELGLMYMRLGEEVEAEKLLKESFEIDPFNVRVSNTLKVLDVLAGYAVKETEHFIIKFDRGSDEILAHYAARYLEDEVYPALVEHLGYAPTEKSLFEIFSRAKNTDGHGWFSARMVGLPYVGTVGACAGKMVAMASPNDGKQKFNWARVLKHEFVHVVNLQQTDFNIPHWYTEALAVRNEGFPRPREWTDLLAQRMAKDQLFNLETINLGFIRPKSSQEWTLAYCQAELYADFMVARHGEDSLAKMLKAYADNLTTRAALQRSFGVKQEEFEAGYREHLQKLVSSLPASKRSPPMPFAELERAQKQDPNDLNLAAQLAHEYLKRRTYPRARELAESVLAKQPRHQLASYVMARLKMLVGEDGEAVRILEQSLDRAAPQENILAVLAAIKLKSQDYAAAAELYELGARHEPANLEWQKSLARLHLETKDDKQLVRALTTLAEADSDDATLRRKLAQLALKEKDYAAAARWCKQAVHIDVMDADVHRMWAEALSGEDKLAGAIEEYEMAVRLKPDDANLRMALAETCVRGNEPDKARAALDALLRIAPDHPGAAALLKRLPN